MITNKELIDLNQDELAQPAEFVGQYGNLYYFQKPLSNGDVAIAVTNVGDRKNNSVWSSTASHWPRGCVPSRCATVNSAPTWGL